MKTRWSRKFDCCQECGSTTLKHSCHGYCVICAQRVQRHARGLKKVYKSEHKLIENIECKHCYQCDKWLPLSKFTTNRRSWDGLKCICSSCGYRYSRKYSTPESVRRERQRNHKARRRKSDTRKLEILDKQGGCHICSMKYVNLCVYDLHHLDPDTKSYTPSKHFQRAGDRWQEEASKCVMVCSNCHILIHDIGFENAQKYMVGFVNIFKSPNKFVDLCSPLPKKYKSSEWTRNLSDGRKFALLDSQEHKGCSVCQVRYNNARVYSLHHLDPNTKDAVPSHLLKKAGDEWIKEAEKCTIVCLNCHELVHDVGTDQAREIIKGMQL